ncbi:putative transmembrane protein PGPGW [Halospina denitrificans]|uniref:Putative transmembrane protein PGPGW n=1 Tax=Halospina denitrificans TaxID=332522 RepID=A0A4R7JQ06_9GAMM|nr:PGPGW domain-containing protein [Halospina denitrificans]TDT40190.1 putative transmembrane protein PGPGW [Halospina denitrificans]
MTFLIEWFQANDTVLWWLGGVSVVTFVGTLIAVPIVVIRIPSDYFSHPERQTTLVYRFGTAVGTLLLVLKNLLGIVLLLAGIAMLVLPGQGLITMFVSLTLLNFPGKYRLERWVISRGAVFRSINWIRQRRGYRPLDARRPKGG